MHDTLLLFGATGDLAQRYLFPSLLRLHGDGLLPAGFRVRGLALSGHDSEAFRAILRERLSQLRHYTPTPAQLEQFLARVDYRPVDLRSPASVAEAVADRIGQPCVSYLSIPPGLYISTCQGLAQAGAFAAPNRLMLEKPIGHDLDSAREINASIGALIDEDRIFRIDHYLGKAAVQNLMALRFGNTLLEAVWNRNHIDSVNILVSETEGVDGRNSYYARSGALRDMVQSHILQLLCLVAMEPPAALQADAVRDEKLKVLRSLKPIRGEDVAHLSVRGQYRAGASSGAAVPGYLEELGKPDSRTETFVALKAEVDNWRWAGVPFYLRTGKRLAERVSEIVIAFKQIPHSIFDDSAGPVMGNKLVLRLQPDEGVKLWLMIKDPGPGGLRLQHVPLDMSFAEAFGVHQPEAYERLLMDVVRGNQTLFMRRDEVEAAWAWIDPILSAWDNLRDAPKPYTAGSWGPSAAVALVERDGRTWHEDTV